MDNLTAKPSVRSFDLLMSQMIYAYSNTFNIDVSQNVDDYLFVDEFGVSIDTDRSPEELKVQQANLLSLEAFRKRYEMFCSESCWEMKLILLNISKPHVVKYAISEKKGNPLGFVNTTFAHSVTNEKRKLVFSEASRTTSVNNLIIDDFKKVGFFAEHFDDTAYPSVGIKHIYEYRIEEKPLLLRYLKESTPLALAPGIVKCLMGCNSLIIGTKAIFTDGFCIWPNELLHYIECHDFQIPKTWLEMIQKQDFKLKLLPTGATDFILKNFQQIALMI